MSQCLKAASNEIRNPKKVLCLHDLSSVGRCSLSTVVSVLSSMGIEPVALPTALYSMHTGFKGFAVLDTSQFMQKAMDSWQGLDLQFDAIFSGFLKGEAQIDAVASAIEKYKCLSVVDPAFADDGKLYDGYSKDFVKRFAKNLLPLADIILPNMSELMFLTETQYQEPPYSSQFVRHLTTKLLHLGAKKVIVSGILSECNDDFSVKTSLLGNFDQTINFDFDADKSESGDVHSKNSVISVVFCDHESLQFVTHPVVKGNFSGAGDLWASFFVSFLLNNCCEIDSIKKSNNLVLRAIESTTKPNLGINFFHLLKLTCDSEH